MKATGRKLGNTAHHDFDCYSKIKKGSKAFSNRLVRRWLNNKKNFEA